MGANFFPRQYMDAMMRKVTEGSVGGVMVGSERVVVTQRLDINISARKSEVLCISRGEGDVKMGDLQLRG